MLVRPYIQCLLLNLLMEGQILLICFGHFWRPSTMLFFWHVMLAQYYSTCNLVICLFICLSICLYVCLFNWYSLFDLLLRGDNSVKISQKLFSSEILISALLFQHYWPRQILIYLGIIWSRDLIFVFIYY